jgi:hypothetical protein
VVNTPFLGCFFLLDICSGCASSFSVCVGPFEHIEHLLVDAPVADG